MTGWPEEIAQDDWRPWTAWQLTIITHRVTIKGMIRSFRDRRTEKIFRRDRVKGISQIVQRSALRKLVMLDVAERLADLRIPPGNRLEKLKGSRKGQYSIRVNDQWRVCFEWSARDAHRVEMTDYH